MEFLNLSKVNISNFFDVSLRSRAFLKSSRVMLPGMHFRQDEGLEECVYKYDVYVHKYIYV